VRGPFDDLMDASKTMAAFSAEPSHFLLLELLYFTLSILGFVMFLALHERMQADAVYLTRIMLIAASVSTAAAISVTIGLLMGGGIMVPAQDVSAFRALGAMCLSLAYVGYHTHGWAVLLMGCAVLKTRSFSRILGWLFIFAGIVWIPTTIILPLSQFSQRLFIAAALLSVVATVWIGIALLRQKQPQPAAKEMAASR
jgi:hypothetical protein